MQKHFISFAQLTNSWGSLTPITPLAYALVDCTGICVEIILLIVYLSESA